MIIKVNVRTCYLQSLSYLLFTEHAIISSDLELPLNFIFRAAGRNWHLAKNVSYLVGAFSRSDFKIKIQISLSSILILEATFAFAYFSTYSPASSQLFIHYVTFAKNLCKCGQSLEFSVRLCVVRKPLSKIF